MSNLNLTDKSSEVINAALEKASEMANSQVHPLHLIAILWDDPTPQGSSSSTPSQPTLLKAALETCHGNSTQFNRTMMSKLNKLPQVDPPPTKSDITPTRSFAAVLDAAQKLQKDGQDQFVAIDHLLLALLKVDHSEFKDLLKAAGVEPKAFEAEVKRKRGGRKVDSRSAEGQFDALNKCELTCVPHQTTC